jgi:O-antigen/teichoic acid export membrane protein
VRVRRLLGIGSVYTLGGVAQMAASAAAVPAITRLLGAGEYGQVTVVVAVVAVLAPAIAVGLPAAIARLYFGADDLAAPGPEIARRLAGTCAAVAALGAASTAATALLWGSWLEPVARGALLTGIATALPLIVMGSTMSILQVQERPVAYVTVSLLGSAGAQLLGIAALAFVAATPTAYLGGYGAGVSVAALAGAVLSGTLGAGLADRRTVRAAMAIGAPAIPHAMAIFVLALGDRLIIQSIDGTVAVGRYQVAYALGALPLALLAALQTAWVPITFGAAADRRWESLASSAAVISRLGAVLVAAVVVLSPVGLAALAPASFGPGELEAICAIVALGALPWCIYLPLSQVLFWERRTKPLLWVTPTAAVVNLALAAILLPPFGLEGAAAATFLALALQAVLLERVTRAMAPVPWRWRAMLGNAAAGASIVAVVLALPGGAPGALVRGLLLIALLVVAARTVAAAARPGHATSAT